MFHSLATSVESFIVPVKVTKADFSLVKALVMVSVMFWLAVPMEASWET